MPSPAIVSTATTVQIHPLVLLSATDHYNRVAKDTKKRVVGVLLGQQKGKVVNVANSFAGKKKKIKTLILFVLRHHLQEAHPFLFLFFI